MKLTTDELLRYGTEGQIRERLETLQQRLTTLSDCTRMLMNRWEPVGPPVYKGDKNVYEAYKHMLRIIDETVNNALES